MIKSLLLVVIFVCSSTASAISLGSKHAIMIDENSGQILFQKNATDIVPIASLTKLMTAMVILDAHLDMDALITITDDDVDTLKFSSSRVPVGSTFARSILLELALMSSDNRAAHALGRTYPGGLEHFLTAVRNKAMALKLRRTNIEEPTGLSPYNTSTASDMAKIVLAAASYPEIGQITSTSDDMIDVGGRATHYHNTNRLVSDKGWSILLSKTGFTNEAGRCLAMRVHVAGRNVIMVLLNAHGSANRTKDANRLHQLLIDGQSREMMAELGYK